MDTFWQSYTALVADLYPPLRSEDGVPETAIAVAEQRLGVFLPRRLRECYLFSGSRSDIHRSLDALLPLNELACVSDGLVFYVENQAVVVWAIRLHDAYLDDPPVYVAENATPFIWQPVFEHLTSFLHFMLLWQAMGGGTSNSANGLINSEAVVHTIAANWTYLDVPIGQNWSKMQFYHKPGQILCVLGEEVPITLYVATKTSTDLMAITRELDVDWLVTSEEER